MAIEQTATILVVDDDRLLVDTLAIWLEDEGFTVLRAYDGLQGVAAAERSRPDLVLADISMPGLDGIRLAQALSERGVPVVLVSSQAGPPETLPHIPFVRKPFDIAAIFDLINKTLRGRDGRASRA
jgi:DNA-binding response OmpR family regulator